MARITHVFWDWNGTLLDDAWLCLDVMNGLVEARGLSRMTPERYQEIFDFPIVHYYNRIGFDMEKETFEALGREFMDEYERRRREAHLYEDAVSALESVRDQRLGQSILSAYRHETLLTLVEEHGLTPFFRDLHGHDHIYPTDKTPQGRKALEDLSLDPAETVLIGDTVHDAEVAAELGMACILVPGGNQSEARLRTAGVPMAATRMEALNLLERQ
jgi:phosphoglycolate phosphatase